MGLFHVTKPDRIVSQERCEEIASSPNGSVFAYEHRQLAREVLYLRDELRRFEEIEDSQLFNFENDSWCLWKAVQPNGDYNCVDLGKIPCHRNGEELSVRIFRVTHKASLKSRYTFSDECEQLYPITYETITETLDHFYSYCVYYLGHPVPDKKE